MRLLTDRRGDFAYFAIIVVFMLLPLSSLSIDITRGMYVRSHLQAATDAACQAATDALDAPLFIETGQKRIKPSLARAQAGRVFSATLVDADGVAFAPSLSVQVISPQSVRCNASASIARILPATPEMTAIVSAVSEMRVGSQ